MTTDFTTGPYPLTNTRLCRGFLEAIAAERNALLGDYFYQKINYQKYVEILAKLQADEEHLQQVLTSLSPLTTDKNERN